MTISKRTAVGQITVDPTSWAISVRTDTIVEEDGKEVSRSFHRGTFAPSADVAALPPAVAAVATALWTPEIIAGAQDPYPTPQQIQARFVAMIQARLDAFARTRNYDGILSACTYATDPDPVFAAEGQYCVEKRGETWRTGYAILAEVQAGTRPVPTSLEDIEDDLPALEWPQ